MCLVKPEIARKHEGRSEKSRLPRGKHSEHYVETTVQNAKIVIAWRGRP